MEHRFRFHPQNKIFPRVNIAWNIQRKESFIAKTLTSRVVIFSLFSYGSVLCLLWNEVTCETREGNSRYPIPKLNKIVPPRPNIYSPVWLLRFLSHRGRYTSEDKKMKILNKSSRVSFIFGRLNRERSSRFPIETTLLPRYDRSSFFHALPHKMFHGLPPSTSLSIWLAGAEAGLGGAKSRVKQKN